MLIYFGLNSSDAPAIRFITIETNTKYRLAPDNLTTEAIGTFCQDVLGGRIQVGCFRSWRQGLDSTGAHLKGTP